MARLRRTSESLGAALLLLAGTGHPALAHAELPALPDSVWMSWSFAPEILLPLLLVWWLYGRGLAALWGRAGVRGVRPARAASFAAGWWLLIVALVSPLDAMSDALASAHMAQHLILVLLAPPLLMLGAPEVTMLWALPPDIRGRVAAPFQTRPVRILLSALAQPGPAAALHGAAIWLWHLPGPYQAALDSEMLHTLEHVILLGTAWLFWRATMFAVWRGDAHHGAAMLALLTTMMHTGLLGALLTFGGRPWYPGHAPWAEAWGLTPMEDQQIAGLLMWVPMGFVYLAAALLLLSLWLTRLERRQQ